MIKRIAIAGLLLAAVPAAAQTEWRTNDRVLRAIWDEGMQRSQLEPMAAALLDSIGPRLTGSPGQRAAHEWAAARMSAWGAEARNEPYGEWIGWRRGPAHVDLVEPRVRSLEARLLSYSRGTDGPVTGDVVVLPELADTVGLRAWFASVRGKFVLLDANPVTCRPIENWQQWARPETLAGISQQIARTDTAWERRLARWGMGPEELTHVLGQAGAAGVLTNDWTGGWGTEFVHMATTPAVPVLNVTCEDYGLLFRLARNGQGPALRVDARAEYTGAAQAMNTVAMVRGRRLPNEYVVLSAHFDSWDAASGATDNGTGVLVMMEAMRILRRVYPNPRRTIVVGLWSGEEQGLNGSRAFAEDHPEVVDGMQVLLNQDTGTGVIDRISFQGFTGAAPFFRRWLARVPPSLGQGIELDDPGLPSAGSSDHSSFVCRGAPGFWLLSRSWDYGTYTWHTNRDTYDKVVFDEVRRNAVLLAMLAYQASEDPQRMPRTMREIPATPQGQPSRWPACQPAARTLQ
ncbi:M20/M25/M40 family metallo-hydrolase [Longimicrobium sp.]|uniref:M20/M25/M40 family metallo-hydrolase n=1 Tax=Longimicrobium sp. TaxID=2029185 RepID=UPI002E32E9F4|nr:M20/M25/M40 family metallo-hydrolase [Longimicrobium sp.]HEX6038756.1 M20/M25/M40 family metallo-hydrolase [Longimicrobium sp.]